MSKRHGFQCLLVSVFVIGASLTAGCGASPEHALAMAPMAAMPGAVQAAAPRTQQAYQFAFANPEVLKEVPCYCGCDKTGHKSNYDCYVSGVDAAGQALYEPHALGCNICVDITQDAMRLLRDGQSAGAIHTLIDKAYAKYEPTHQP